MQFIEVENGVENGVEDGRGSCCMMVCHFQLFVATGLGFAPLQYALVLQYLLFNVELSKTCINTFTPSLNKGPQ